MSYRCSICGDVVEGKQKRHVVKRPSGEIERELPVCSTCDALLRDGHRIDEVRKIQNDARGIATPLKVLIANNNHSKEGANDDA